MFIKEVLWLDEVSKEAQVIVSDGKIDIICFSHPFTWKVFEVLRAPVYCLNISHLVVSDNLEMFAKKSESYWEYWVCGKLLHRKSGEICVGEIVLEVDCCCIPRDIQDGTLIEFNVSRFDL